MAIIESSIKIDAPSKTVWDLVSDLDAEPKYWKGTKSVKTISRNGNTVQREVIIAFRDKKCEQTVQIVPEESIKITFTAGIILGTKTITVQKSEQMTVLSTAMGYSDVQEFIADMVLLFVPFQYFGSASKSETKSHTVFDGASIFIEDSMIAMIVPCINYYISLCAVWFVGIMRSSNIFQKLVHLMPINFGTTLCCLLMREQNCFGLQTYQKRKYQRWCL